MDNNIIIYKNTLITFDSSVNTRVMMNAVRYMFGGYQSSIDSVVEEGIILTNKNVYYRIPFENTYINSNLDTITVNHTKGINAKHLLPRFIEKGEYSLEKNKHIKFVIGNNFSLEELYMFSKYSIYIPEILLPDNKYLNNVRQYYSKIKFVMSRGTLHPILIGSDIAFSRYISKDQQYIEIGVSPEYPSIILKEVNTSKDMLVSESLYNKYKYIFKYMELSPTMGNDSILSGYLCFPNTLNLKTMVHLETTGYNKNLSGVNILYLIASSLMGGRTTEKFSLYQNKLLKGNNLKWVNEKDIFGNTYGMVYTDEEYIKRLKQR